MKPCSSCGIIKPLDHFAVEKRVKDNRSSICKPCRTLAAGKRRDKIRQEMIDVPDADIFDGSDRYCQRCKKTLPKTRENWIRSNTHRTGVQVYCRDCNYEAKRKSQNEYYHRNSVKLNKKKKYGRRINRVVKSMEAESFCVYYNKKTDKIGWSRIKVAADTAEINNAEKVSKQKVIILKAYSTKEEAESVSNILTNRTAETTDRQDLVPLFKKITKYKAK